jgi:FkbM family methyltransferase
VELIANLAGHTIVVRNLTSQSVVLDLGANLGSFSRAVFTRYRCRCYAVEANPFIIEEIRGGDYLTVANFAVANHRGSVQLTITGNTESSTILPVIRGDIKKSVSVPAITLEELFGELGLKRVDLIKIDIEGAEIQVLDACSDEFLRNIPQLTIEFHDFQGMTPIATIERVVDRLRRLGFFPIKMWRTGYGDTLFINRNALNVSYIECLWARYITRNWWGFKRALSRALANNGASAAKRATAESGKTSQGPG